MNVIFFISVLVTFMKQLLCFFYTFLKTCSLDSLMYNESTDDILKSLTIPCK